MLSHGVRDSTEGIPQALDNTWRNPPPAAVCSGIIALLRLLLPHSRRRLLLLLERPRGNIMILIRLRPFSFFLFCVLCCLPIIMLLFSLSPHFQVSLAVSLPSSSLGPLGSWHPFPLHSPSLFIPGARGNFSHPRPPFLLPTPHLIHPRNYTRNHHHHPFHLSKRAKRVSQKRIFFMYFWAFL